VLASLHCDGGGGVHVALRSHVRGARGSGGAASDSFVLPPAQLGSSNTSPRSANESDSPSGRRAVFFMVTPRATNYLRQCSSASNVKQSNGVAAVRTLFVYGPRLALLHRGVRGLVSWGVRRFLRTGALGRPSTDADAAKVHFCGRELGDAFGGQHRLHRRPAFPA
jgi:hypothetical protein